MSKYISVFISVLFLTIVLLTSCKKEDNPVESTDNPTSAGPIKTGDVVQVTSKDISSSGGTIIVSQANSPVNGLTIVVPQNGYSNTRTYSVSYAPISSHTLGSNFNPVSPLISIKNGGGFSSSPITIKVPIKKAKDEFAIGFLYDPSTGKVEALPAKAADDSSVTVTISRFETPSAALQKRSANSYDGTSVGNLVISSLKESFLSGQSVISTGFTPGVDDWEFINYGSYVAPGGHCAGQSITAMWYFYEKKLKGEAKLFHRFDKVNNSLNPSLLWQDNPLGFRFASTIQEDFDWDGWIRNVNLQSYLPVLTWKTFIAAMLITGEPQFVIIKKSVTNEGHAMIVYKINLSEGKLYIADPNYPNNRGSDGTATTRTITYANGKFDPYASFLKVGDPGIIFDQIAFFGKTANLDWGQISKRYAEIQTKTIGNDRFPKYNLFVKYGSNSIALQDGMVVNKDSLNIYCKSTDIPTFLTGTDHYQDFYMYDTTGAKLGEANAKGIGFVKLKPGANKIGIYISGGKTADVNAFVDFLWVTVYYQNLSIDPNPLQGEPTKEYKLTARSKGTAPKGNSKFVWTFGDNTSQATVTNDSTVLHTYTAEGTFNVKVELYENSTNKKLMEATSTANIVKASDLLKQLQGTVQLSEECSFDYVNQVGYTWSTGVYVLALSQATLKWTGTTFTYGYETIEAFNTSGSKANYYTTVTGTVSADAKTILEITYFHKVEYYDYFAIRETNTEKMTFKNVPITRWPGYQEWGSGTTYTDFYYELDKAGSLANATFYEWLHSKDPQFDIIGIDKIKKFGTPLKVIFKYK